MKAMLSAVLGAVLLWSCGAWGANYVPLVEIRNEPAVRSDNSPVDVARLAEAVRAAGTKQGWRFSEGAPDHLVGTYDRRGGKHTIVVDIHLRRGAFDILYRTSVNMNAGDAEPNTGRADVGAAPSPQVETGKRVRVIHPKYHAWTRNLAGGIQAELLR